MEAGISATHQVSGAPESLGCGGPRATGAAFGPGSSRAPHLAVMAPFPASLPGSRRCCLFSAPEPLPAGADVWRVPWAAGRFEVQNQPQNCGTRLAAEEVACSRDASNQTLRKVLAHGSVIPLTRLMQKQKLTSFLFVHLRGPRSTRTFLCCSCKSLLPKAQILFDSVSCLFFLRS